MNKFFSKLICYLISFQLLVICNDSHMYLAGSVGSNDFSISGLIVKSFEKVSDSIFPSAMAADVKTGEVTVYTVNENNEMVEIASHDLYNNQKKFNFKVSKSLVNESVLYFSYTKVGEEDRRNKIEVFDNKAVRVYTELNAQSTFASDIIKEDIKEALDANPHIGLDGIKNIVKSYKKEDYNAAVQAVGGYSAYVSSFPTTTSSTNLVKLIKQNKNETSQAVLKDEFRSELLAAQYAKVAGGKLDCLTGDKTSVTNSSSDAFDGMLYFTTKDETTAKVIGGSSKDLGNIKDEKTGTSMIASFLADLMNMAIKLVTTLKGAFGLLDRSNSILTTCSATITPPEVAVSSSGAAPASGAAPGSGAAPASGSAPVAKAPVKSAK